MLRIFQEVISSPADSMNKVDAEMRTGMGVISNYSNKTISFPTEEMGSNVEVLDKERIATGINAGRGDMSDYDEHFTTLEVDEMGKLFNFAPKAVFGTDQFIPTGLAENDMVAVGTDGIWKKATVPSIYKFTGLYNDNGHELARIKVLQAPVTN